MNSSFLKTFLTLARSGSFTKTAQSLHMTQPGVSQHIKKLEEDCNTALLVRYGKSFELTPKGEMLLQFAQDYFEKEANLLHALSQDDTYSGHVSVACSGALALKIYPALLQLQKRHPSLQISLEAAPNKRIIDLLETSDIDIGLVTQKPRQPSLITEVIGEDSLCLILPQDEADTWQNLMRLGFIDHPDGFHYLGRLLDQNFPNEFTSLKAIPVSGYINQLSQILLPVSEGLGFTALPETALAAFPNKEKLRKFVLRYPVSETLYLALKRQRPLAKRHQIVVDQIKSLVANNKQSTLPTTP